MLSAQRVGIALRHQFDLKYCRLEVAMQAAVQRILTTASVRKVRLTGYTGLCNLESRLSVTCEGSVPAHHFDLGCCRLEAAMLMAIERSLATIC